MKIDGDLGGSFYNNIVWPCKCNSRIIGSDKTNNILWNVVINPLSLDKLKKKKQFKGLILDEDWLKIPKCDKKRSKRFFFGDSYQYTKDIARTFHEAPNEVRVKVFPNYDDSARSCVELISKPSDKLLFKPFLELVANPTFENRAEIRNKLSSEVSLKSLKEDGIKSKEAAIKAFEMLEAFVNVDIQFNYSEMKKYCEKDSVFLSDQYSGRITKYEWNLDFIDIKPELNEVFISPYPWQKFFQDQVLPMKPDSRVVDWLIDPVGNTGKSTFVRAYVSQKRTDGILMKIDNLDRMELTLIQKITNYRWKRSKSYIF